LIVLGATVATAGCSKDSAEQERKVRDEVAKAVEKAKPEIQQAGRDLKAAAEGAKEGWERGNRKELNLNSASEDDLATLPGISRREARRIIAARPYREKHDLVSRKILTEPEYEKIQNFVRAK
jgi:DNA uptake protein ComE-like DNA-binding protein